MKNLFKGLLYSLLLKYPYFSAGLGHFIGGRCQQNINLNLLNPRQKKVLICYLYLEDIDFNNISHAAYMHANQMIKCFIDKKYCVDVCACYDMLAYKILKNKKYDIILGLGKVFKEMCKSQSTAQKIVFVTENNPIVVAEKYAERISYFKQRHPDVDYSGSLVRNGFIDEEMFKIADMAIIMNSQYNVKSMKHYFDNVYLVNSNAFFNAKYLFNEIELGKRIDSTKCNFLWFGSSGLIHKGLDILIDAFREMPEYSIDCYGLDKREKKIFEKLKCVNVVDCGYINVLNIEFVEKIINSHCFVLFPSCSEGMSTAVATCMAHGIIPIITKECGFEPCEYIFELAGWHVEDIKNIVKRVVSMSNEDILKLRKECYQYARKHFSLEAFDNSFGNIVKSISEEH